MFNKAPGARPHSLFSFGTLLEENVQVTLFGHAVPGAEASLAGYATRPLVITDAAVIATSGSQVHLTLKRELGSVVTGGVLRLSDEELAAADAYEVDDYARRRVLLSSGESAWAYLDAEPLRSASRVLIAGGGEYGRLAAERITKDEAHHRLFNAAVPGNTLTEITAQIPELLPRHRPDTVVFAAGIDGNDDWPATIAADLARLAEIVLRGNGRLVIAGPTAVDDERIAETQVPALRDALSTWCIENHVDYLA
ncbi:gamma-glutamylcyclotransferase [Actinospica robiniae]|uniref:gamma-glutamylcyclotransferase n=1 Tax=Actinospica robiniae TaxID=304901 RepID=UPI0007C5AC3D|nr:gamma-glutamylcyclotransferase [Actinospica robiniae]